MRLGLFVVLLIGAFSLAGCNRTGNSAPANTSKNTSSNRVETELLDLNSASKAELIRLPGIGDAYAQRIIDHRPYREKTDLIRRDIIPETTYREIQDRVIARHK